MKKIKRLIIIPARSGSVRIKNKNIKKFINKPIIFYSIENAIKSKLFSKIHVSTDSNKIRKIVQKKLKIDFMRPKRLSQDTTKLIDVYKYVVNKYQATNNFFHQIWFLMPCSPLISKKDLINASRQFDFSKSKAILAVCKHSPPIQWAFKIKRRKLQPIFKNLSSTQEKFLEEYYFDTGTFGIYDSNIFYKKNKFQFDPFFLDKKKSIDIDTLEDWYIAEKLFKNK